MLLVTFICLVLAQPPEIVLDTIRESVVSTSIKQALPKGKIASQITSINSKDIGNQLISAPKRLSSIVPNLHIPDYGSSMTSTIYLRGFGSRIDNPVIGLYIDDIPIIDKNSYDFDFIDINRIDLLRGPQGTLFGRNSMTGLLSISTVSPSDKQGSDLSVEAGPVEYQASASYYHKGEKAGAASYGGILSGRYSSGYYKNGFTGRQADRYAGVNTRFKYQKQLRSGIFLENTFSGAYLRQGGYAYRQYIIEEKRLQPLAYNDFCGYRRFNLTDGVKLEAKTAKWKINSISSAQLLFDKMQLDQDFTTKSMFTLTQEQKQAAVTQEVIIKPLRPLSWWRHQSGAFVMLKYNNMQAPVNFKQDGIRELILDNANKGIPDWLGKLEFQESSFIISSDFNIATYNAALYHESYFSVSDWIFTAGLRLDHEGNFMGYDSRALIHYRIAPGMSEYRAFAIKYDGMAKNFYWQLIPKFSALYDFGKLKAFATISKGYKSGGFNTQIFSDILQNKMMVGMMEDSGVYSDNKYAVSADNTTYKPEMSFNYELGVKYGNEWDGHRLSFSGSAYYIDCINQQITVFPPGKSTGRMMANAGKSHSLGAEAEASYNYKGISAQTAFGYTDARFDKYNDGNTDYSGNHIPYSPAATLFCRAAYTFHFNSAKVKSLAFGADYNMTGRIWWNEDNSLSQPAYGTAGADTELKFKMVTVFARADNIFNKQYKVFYFKSIGNSFFQEGKPFRFVLGLRIKL